MSQTSYICEISESAQSFIVVSITPRCRQNNYISIYFGTEQIWVTHIYNGLFSDFEPEPPDFYKWGGA